MNCKRITKELNAYVDGELSPRQASQVERHLEQCPQCARRRDELLRLNQALEVLPDLGSPAGFRARLRALAREHAGAGRKVATILPLPRVRLATAAAAALVLAAGLLLGGFMSGSISAAKASHRRMARAYEVEFGSLDTMPLTSLAAAYLQVGDQPR